MPIEVGQICAEGKERQETSVHHGSEQHVASSRSWCSTFGSFAEVIYSIGCVYEGDSWSDPYDPCYYTGCPCDSNATEQQTHGGKECTDSEEKLGLPATLDSESCVGMHWFGGEVAVGNDEVLDSVSYDEYCPTFDIPSPGVC